jgi:hypothetical protein
VALLGCADQRVAVLLARVLLCVCRVTLGVVCGTAASCLAAASLPQQGQTLP